jgi:hypothetical protein
MADYVMESTSILRGGKLSLSAKVALSVVATALLYLITMTILAPSAQANANGSVGAHRLASNQAVCIYKDNGTKVVRVFAPEMWGNTTASQYLGYSVRAYRWNGSSWPQYTASSYRHAIVSNMRKATFQTGMAQWTVPTNHYYKAGVAMRWYRPGSNTSSVMGSALHNVTTWNMFHYDNFGDLVYDGQDTYC